MKKAEQLLSRFEGLKRAHGVYAPDGSTDVRCKAGGRAWTKPAPPTEKLWEQHLAGKNGLGVVPITDEGTVRWGAIDVDVYGEKFDVFKLEEEVRELKLPLIVFRSKSGGAHVYLFLAEHVKAEIVRKKLMEWAIVLGHPGVEVFPKQTQLGGPQDMGNWLNMPYYNEVETNRYAIKEGKQLSVEGFLEYAQEMQVSAAILKRIRIEKDEELADGPPCLQQLCKRGFPAGTRNNGLFNLAVYARLKHGDNWKDKVDEYNRGNITTVAMKCH
jgi:hypothetical protein